MEQWKLFHKTSAWTGGWESTKGRERLWFVSDHGNVKVVKSWNGEENTPSITETGGHKNSGRYLALSINTAPEKYIHRLVASAFLPNPEGKATINHKDGNKSNNHIDNLEWATYSENVQHAVQNGLSAGRKKLNK